MKYNYNEFKLALILICILVFNLCSCKQNQFPTITKPNKVNPTEDFIHELNTLNDKLGKLENNILNNLEIIKLSDKTYNTKRNIKAGLDTMANIKSLKSYLNNNVSSLEEIYKNKKIIMNQRAKLKSVIQKIWNGRRKNRSDIFYMIITNLNNASSLLEKLKKEFTYKR